METSSLLLNALLHGSILSLALGALMYISFALAPDMWVGDYPRDIQETYGPMGEKGKRYRPLIGILFFGTVIAVVLLSFGSLRGLSPAEPEFPAYFLTAFIVLMVFNLFDLLIVDWLFFVAIQPKLIICQALKGWQVTRIMAFIFAGSWWGSSSAVSVQPSCRS